MAITASDVTINYAWTQGGTNGLKLKCLQVTFAVSSDGAGATDIPASAFGLTKIVEGGPFMSDGDDVVVLGVPSYAGTYLFLATAESSGHTLTPTDQTDTFRGVVKGY